MALDHVTANQSRKQQFGQTSTSVAAAGTAVIDCRGARTIVAYSTGGSATAQPCDPGGTALPSAAAGAMTLGTPLTVAALFYKIAASTATVVIVVIY